MTSLRKLLIAVILLAFACLACAKQTPAVIPEVSFTPEKSAAAKSPEHGQTTHISQEKIDGSPVVNLSEIFSQEQSIVRLTNNSGDSSQTALSLRGFGDNAVANSLILVDGFPLTNPSLLAPNFNSIPLTDIKRIDIFQGSEGTRWGNQAVGGVINIITRHPQKLYANAIAGVGSFNKTYFNLTAGDKYPNGFFIKGNGFAGKTDNYRDHNREDNNNIFMQAGLDDAHGTTSINLQTYEDTTNFPGGLPEEAFLVNPRQATTFDNYSHYRTQQIQLFNQHEISSVWLIETRLSHQITDGNGFVFLHYNRRDTQTFFSPRLSGRLFNSKILAGYDGQLSYYKMLNAKVQPRTSARQNDIYLQVVTPLASTVDLTLGGRAAWQNNSIEKIVGQRVYSLNRVFVSEQGITYHPTQQWSFFLRRDGNFSFPKANEETWVPVNQTALNTQTGVSYEAGAEWQNDFLNTQVSIYRLELNHEIAFNPQQTAAQPFGSFNNWDKTLRHGITITENWTVTQKISLDGQINYVNARMADGVLSGKAIPAVPAINGNIGLNLQIAPRWQTKYSALYTGSRYASDDVTNNGKKLSGYWLNNIALQYVTKPVNVSFEIINLFNQNYAAYAFYAPATGTNTYYPGAGRNYLLTFKLNLD